MALAADIDLKHLLGSDVVTLAQHAGPHSGLSLALRPAPAHLPSQDPLWDLLTCLPPSNLLRMCMYPSAKFVVKFPVKELILDIQFHVQVHDSTYVAT